MVPEEPFYEDRANGIVRPNTLPLPEGVSRWMRAEYKGEPCHFARKDDTIWLVIDTTRFGYCMFKKVCRDEDGTTFKAAYRGGERIIAKERSQVIMSTTLNDVARRYAGPQASVPTMNLQGNTAAPMQPVSGEGVSTVVEARRLHSEMLTRAYLAGYVMANAPAISLTVNRKQSADGTTVANIVAKQSKPSRCLSVMLALPANCVQRNGVLTQPSDIAAGLVDYSSDKGDMIYQPMDVPAAIGYISAMGGRIAEYAPHVSDAKEQWSASDILSGKPEVSFVYVKPTENKSKTSRSQDLFRFSLKTTSPRKSLYTPKNHVCLRALEHTSVKCDSEKRAYELNEIAFGAMRYRKKKDEVENALQRAMRDCPSQIWSKTYDIDGEKKEGIGSAFFMAGTSIKSAAGEEIVARPLTYTPWDQSGGARGGAAGDRVESIVLRVFRPADGSRKENMVTKPIFYRESPNDPAFRGYARFVDFLLSTGFITRENLVALGSRSSKSKIRAMEMTPEQKTSLEYFLRSEAVEASISAVIGEAADRAVLRDAAR